MAPLEDRQPIRILIAEDSPTQAAHLRELLERNGYVVTAARNGIEALDLFGEADPSLVITDVVMPEMDGYGLCRSIKADPVRKSVPVMLVTTLSDAGDVIRGLECGADNFIRKPYEEKYLLSRIRYLLMNVAMRRSQRVQIGVEISLGDKTHFITSDRQQVLDLLISTYEQAININDDLKGRERDLGRANQVLTGLYRIAEGLNQAATEREVAELTLERALALPGIAAGWIFLCDDDGAFRLAAERNLPPQLLQAGVLDSDCECRRRLLDGSLDSVNNILECELLKNATYESNDIRYHASIPLRLDDRTLGVMNIVGPDEGLFAEDELRTLYSVGTQVAIALDRARLREGLERLVEERTAKLEAEIAERIRIEEELRRQARRESVLAELGLVALRLSELEPLLDEAARLVAETIGSAGAVVAECATGGSFAFRATAGADDAAGRVVSKEEAPVATHLIASGEPVVVSELAAETRFTPPQTYVKQGFTHCASVIIRGKDSPWGVLTVFRKSAAFTDGDVYFIRAIANIIAATIARTQSEESLRRSESLLQIASRVGRLGAFAVTLPDETMTFSDEARAIHELDSDDMPTPEEGIRFYAPEYQEEVRKAYHACATEGTPFDLELQLITARNRRIWVRVIGEAERDAAGVIHRVHGAIQDISISKAAVEQTRQLATRLAETFESLTDAFATIDRDWRFTYVNTQAEVTLGKTREELVGAVLWEALPELAETDLGNAYRRAMQQREPVQIETYYPPLAMWLDVRIFPSIQGIAIYGRNVSQQYQAREALIGSERRFRTLTDAMPQLVWLSTGDGQNTYVNQRWIEYTGLSPAQSAGRGWFETMHPDDRDLVASSWAEAGESVSVFEAEIRFRASDGSYRWWLMRAVPVRGAAGDLSSWMGTCTDIDELKQATVRITEQAVQLEESELRYRLLFDRNPHPTWLYDTETLTFLAVNEAAVRHYGYSREEFLRMTIKDIRPPDEVQTLLQVIEENPDTTAPQTLGVFKHRKKDGTEIEVEVSSSEIAFADRRAGLVLAMDVTEKRKLEQQFFRAQRMESIGTLAGGIAHDLNNLLMPIMMGVTLIKRTDPSPLALRSLENIERSAARGKDLVRQVLSFARGIEGARVPVHVPDVAREIRTILESTFPKNISVRMDLDEELAWIDADPTQINQVLLNLCVNARDAMPSGGRLTIASKNVEIDEHYAKMHRDVRAGRFVLIEVTDEGVGMPQNVVDRIFEPFFTTKDAGRGTGLGLSTVATIAKSHGGFVNVYSEPGKGTRFRVYLPAKDEGSTTARAVDVPSLETLPRGNGETVLVVDDELAILAITRETLQAFGYNVLTAEDGAEGIGLFATHRAQIAVVITDMMMPVMDGATLISALQRIDPHVRVIASSGINENVSRLRDSHPSVRSFLQKPYTADTLITTVHNVLLEETTR